MTTRISSRDRRLRWSPEEPNAPRRPTAMWGPRPALYVALHAAGCHMGGISIEAARRFGVSQITMDKNHGFILGAASGRYPITYAIARSINSHPDRVPQSLALRFIDGNAASEDSCHVQRRIIGVGWCLRHLVLILRNNRSVFDAAGAVRRHR